MSMNYSSALEQASEDAVVANYTNFLRSFVHRMRRECSIVRTLNYEELSVAGCKPVGDPSLLVRIAKALRQALNEDIGPCVQFSPFDARRPDLFYLVVSDQSDC